ncbi:unnamed protein product [Mucor hiemalis]
MSLLTRRNVFPSEFLQKVSSHLSFDDWYQCTLVCRFWYHTFQRILYKRIYIYSENHFEELIQLLSTSHTGILIKELHLVRSSTYKNPAFPDDFTYVPPDETLKLSHQRFELISKLCPRLEVIDFDITQWKHINLENTTAVWSKMRSCAPIYYSQFTSTFTSVFGVNLSSLYISHYAQDQDELIKRLGLLATTLQDLTLELVFRDDVETAIPSSCMEEINKTLPRLQKLNLIRNKTPHHEITAHDNHILIPFQTPSKVESLSLHGQVDSIQWFEFISQSYPSLKELKLTQLSTSRFGTKWMWQHSLIQLMQSLPQIKSLTLGGRNVPQLFSKGFAMELKRPDCPIQDLYIDFKTYQAIESCQFLLVVASHGITQLRFLRLRVWEQIPGWSGVTSNLFQCKNLVYLELSLSKGLMDQFPFTPFLIDHFLENMPQLERLALTGANVQVTYNHFEDLNTTSRFALQSLEIYQGKVENHTAVFRYLSTCCPHLIRTVFRKCELEKSRHTQPSLNICEIDLQHSDLEELVLSALMIYTGTIRSNEFIGIRLKGDDIEKTIWCSAIKSVESYAYPRYVLCDDIEKYTELDEVYHSYTSGLATMPGNYSPTIGFFNIYCQSVKHIFLDNLKLKLERLQCRVCLYNQSLSTLSSVNFQYFEHEPP